MQIYLMGKKYFSAIPASEAKLFFDFFLVFACFLGQMSTLDADIPYGEEVLLINFKSKEP
jgi:hypothetical protein